MKSSNNTQALLQNRATKRHIPEENSNPTKGRAPTGKRVRMSTPSESKEILKVHNNLKSVFAVELLPIELWTRVAEHLTYHDNNLTDFENTCKLFKDIVNQGNTPFLKLAYQLYQEGILWGRENQPINVVDAALQSVQAVLEGKTSQAYESIEKLIQAVEAYGSKDALKTALNKIVDDYGETHLHKAARNNNVKAIKLLLAANMDVNAQDDEGMTPLQEAARCGNVEACITLIALGANLDAQDYDGWTPLHYAASHLHAQNCIEPPSLYATATEQCISIVKLLLEANAKVDIPDDQGDTPLFFARQHGNPETIALLEAAAPSEKKAP